MRERWFVREKGWESEYTQGRHRHSSPGRPAVPGDLHDLSAQDHVSQELVIERTQLGDAAANSGAPP